MYQYKKVTAADQSQLEKDSDLIQHLGDQPLSRLSSLLYALKRNIFFYVAWSHHLLWDTLRRSPGW